MAQRDHPVGSNNPISQDQLLAALQLLGIRLPPSGSRDVPISSPALFLAPSRETEAGTPAASQSVTSHSIGIGLASTPIKVHGAGHFEPRLLSAAATAAKEEGHPARAATSVGPVPVTTPAVPDPTPAVPDPTPAAPDPTPAVPKAPPPSPTSITSEPAGCGHFCADCCVGSAVLCRLSSSALFFNQESWYCVFVGRAVGVIRGWAVTKALTDGISNSQFKKFASFEAATAAFAQAKALGIIEVKC